MAISKPRFSCLMVALAFASTCAAPGIAHAEGAEAHPASTETTKPSAARIEASSYDRRSEELERRYLRTKRAGWWITGLSAAGWIATFAAVAVPECDHHDDSTTDDPSGDFDIEFDLCFRGPGFGALAATGLWGVPLATGLALGSAGTIQLNQHRQQRSGAVDRSTEVQLTGSGAAFRYRF